MGGPLATTASRPTLRLPGGAEVAWSNKSDGDLRPRDAQGALALRAWAARPVIWVHQVHGRDTAIVDAPGPAETESGAAARADALATRTSGLALAVFTADCAPLALSSDEGVIAAVHVGWRGLAKGVVSSAVETMRSLGATKVFGALGPCIRAECYAFDAADLAPLTQRFGACLQVTTASGQPGLDLAAGVRQALVDADSELVHDTQDCTACSAERWFSHRARAEQGRQAMVVWKA